jgi:hypothetical protein
MQIKHGLISPDSHTVLDEDASGADVSHPRLECHELR